MKVVSVLNIFIVDNAQCANIWKLSQYRIYLSWTMRSALTYESCLNIEYIYRGTVPSALTYESCLSIEYIYRGTVPSALTLNFETICIVLYPESPQSDVYLSRNRVQWCTGNTISYEVFPLGIYFVKTIEIRSIQNKKRKLIVQKCCCCSKVLLFVEDKLLFFKLHLNSSLVYTLNHNRVYTCFNVQWSHTNARTVASYLIKPFGFIQIKNPILKYFHL